MQLLGHTIRAEDKLVNCQICLTMPQGLLCKYTAYALFSFKQLQSAKKFSGQASDIGFASLEVPTSYKNPAKVN